MKHFVSIRLFRMLLIWAALAVPAAAQHADDAVARAEDARAAAAAQTIHTGLAATSASAVEAVREHGMLADARIVKELARGLKHKDPRVRMAAIRALRFNGHPDAVPALLKLARDKVVRKSPELSEAWYMALGQKAAPKALKYLLDELELDETGEDPVALARLRALGRVREAATVEALIKLLHQSHSLLNHYYFDVRLSLMVLTGNEFQNRDEWQSWWNDNKRGYQVSPEPWELESGYGRKWQAFWRVPLHLDPERDAALRRTDRAKALGGALEGLGGLSGTDGD